MANRSASAPSSVGHRIGIATIRQYWNAEAPSVSAASRHSLDALAALVAGDGDSEAVAVGGDVSVNALVQAALRPMLKQWLDANLPAIVEELVAREIKRIVGGRD